MRCHAPRSPGSAEAVPNPLQRDKSPPRHPPVKRTYPGSRPAPADTPRRQTRWSRRCSQAPSPGSCRWRWPAYSHRPWPAAGRGGVGHQDELRTLEHQDSGALGELPVIADHGPHLYLAATGVQRGDIEILPRRQVPLHVKITGVDLGIGDLPFPEPVKERHGIPGAALVLFQKGDADGHIKFFGESAEGVHKFAASGDRLRHPLVNGAVVDIVAVAPHLGKQRDIRAHILRFPA